MPYSPQSERAPALAMSIPIPYAERSPRGLPSPGARSPSSLSSYRAHPYPRRQSVGNTPQDDRIFLPPPNSGAPLHVLHERQPSHGDPRDARNGGDPRDARDPRDQRDPRDGHHARDGRDRSDSRGSRDSRESMPTPQSATRPPLPRTQSDHSTRYSMGERYPLPSFASLSASATATSSPGGQPSRHLNGSMGPPPPASPESSRAASPKLFSLGGLRPSYSYDSPVNGQHPNGAGRDRDGVRPDDRSPGGHSNHSGHGHAPPQPPQPHMSPAGGGRHLAPGPSPGHGPSPGPGPGANCYRANPSPPRYRDASPPLRSIQQSMAPSPYPPEAYMHAPTAGRSRSHSAASALSSRYGPPAASAPVAAARSASSSDGGDWPTPQTPRGEYGGGQSRRLAHLKSEQKRRESINTGFQALRAALPSSIATDSKAIILRKAVSHIDHLEALLRKAGIPISPPLNQSPVSAPPGLARGDSGSTGDDDMGVIVDADELADDVDMDMRSAVRDVSHLKVDREKGWEEVQVEDIDLDRKPIVQPA